MIRRGRPTSLTAKRRSEFIEALKAGASVATAAEPLLISRPSLYDRRNKDPEFAAEWDSALEIGADKLEDEARRRAYEGVDEPVFYQGRECGYVRKYSDTLLIFLLKGARPEKYRDFVDSGGPRRTTLTLHVDLGLGSAYSEHTSLPQHTDPMVLTGHQLDQQSSADPAEAGMIRVDTPSTLNSNSEGGEGGE